MPQAAQRDAARPFGRYRLVEQIGEGGMAVVYRAIADGPEGFARSFVIKRVLPELSRDPNFARMLIAEARLSALLHHPAIVQVFELGQVGDEYYLAMELVDGIDLVTLLNRCIKLKRRLPIGLVCYLASELAGALGYAHALVDDAGRPLGIIHRDVSPSNVMITQSGGVKLLDFGIAKANQASDDRTRTGRLKGKISYLSPEQADGRAIDQRADIFALGIVFYECLTMRRLFRSGDDLTTLRLVREANVPPPSTVMPDIDPDIDAVVMRMLARDPAARLPDCAAVSDALAPIVHRLEGDAASLRRFVGEVGPFEHKGKTVDDASLSASMSSLRPREQRRARGLWLGAIGSLVLAGAVSIGALQHHHQRARRAAPPVAAVRSQPIAAPHPPPAQAPPSPIVTRLAVRSEPPGANLVVDGKPAGVTPALLSLTLPTVIELRLDGFIPAREVVTRGEELNLRLTRLPRVLKTGQGKSPRPPKRKGHIGLD